MKIPLEHPVFRVVSECAAEMNIPAFVVGGWVRDMILFRPCKDLDFVCGGSGIALAESVAAKFQHKYPVTIFKSFGTAHIPFDGYDLEFVGARKESYRSDSRKPLVEDGTLEDDQRRRDFSINAMAVSLNADNYGELIDPFDGLADIEKKIIRTPLDPDLTYSDDPLRMMRAIRFATELDFNIEQNSFLSISKNRERINIVSPERITTELNKIILSPIPSIGFRHLYDTGLLHLIFPQMVALQGVETINGKSHKDNFYHTLEVLDNLSRTTEDLWLRWAAILHDIAKPATKRFDPVQGWTFHGHEDKGARMVSKIFRQLKLPMNEKMKFVEKMVLLHLRPIVLAQSIVTDSAVRRLLFEAGEDIDSLMKLCTADITSKNEIKVKRYRDNFEKVREKLKEVEEKDHLRNWQPPVDGLEIMQVFGLKPGKEIGIIKTAIREAILEGELKNNREDAIAFMVNEGKKLGLTPLQMPPDIRIIVEKK